MKIMILTHDFECKLVNELKKINNIILKCSYNYQDISSDFDIVFAHNYDKLIPEAFFATPKVGLFVLHSTDLPKGRGWAPIYYSISNNESLYTISLIKISKKVDEGNIFLKLKIKKPLLITNDNLREIDEDAITFLIKEFIFLCEKNIIIRNSLGQVQDHSKATYNKKRTPEDNNLNKERSIENQLSKILATNSDYPAYIIIENTKVYLSARIDKYYNFDDLEYTIERFI